MGVVRVPLLTSVFETYTGKWFESPERRGVSVRSTRALGVRCLRGRVHTRTRGSARSLLLSPGAWIITGGSHTGVMKQVGEAVRDFSLSSSYNEGEVVTIGIATWGTVHNREGLIHPTVSCAAPPAWAGSEELLSGSDGHCSGQTIPWAPS